MGYWVYTGTLLPGTRVYSDVAGGRLMDIYQSTDVAYTTRVEVNGSMWASVLGGWVPEKNIADKGSYWKETASKCTAPTAIALNPSIAEGTVRLSWSGAAGGTDNSIVGYDVQYNDSADGQTWGSWIDSGSFPSNQASGYIDTYPNSNRGHFRTFRLRTKGSAGTSYYSDWSNPAPPVRTNRQPLINGLLVGVECCCRTPVIMASIGAEPDGQSQTVYCQIDGGTKQAMSLTNGLAKLRLSTLSYGVHTLKISAVDSLGAEAFVTKTLTVTAPTYRRSVHTGDIISGNGISHVNDINELLQYINKQRIYYKLNDISLMGVVGLFKDWKTQMEALATALDDCRRFCGEAVKQRIGISRSYPRADVINWLRAYIDEG